MFDPNHPNNPNNPNNPAGPSSASTPATDGGPADTGNQHAAKRPGPAPTDRVRATRRKSFAAFLMSIPAGDTFDAQDFARVQ